MKLGPLQTQWMNELKSGNHSQTCGFLHNNEGFCCLGVLTEIVAKEEPIDIELKEGVRLYKNGVSTITGRPPEHIQQAIALTDHGVSRCMSMNDTEEKSFAEIAEAIEANPNFFFLEAL